MAQTSARQPVIAEDDIVLLNAGFTRRDFYCSLRKSDPLLGFDLRYQAGWQVSLKPNELPPAGGPVRILFRVTPYVEGSQPLYATETHMLPPLDQILGNRLIVYGAFAVGPGKYRVDWLLRDSRSRACSMHWDVEVKHKDDFRLAIPANTATSLSPNRGFRGMTAQIPRANGGRSFHIKILANFSNTDPRRSTLNSQDVFAVTSILRTVAREPRFSRFSLVAFNMQEERVIHQETGVERFNFPAIGRALSELKLGVIDYQRLLDRHSATKFVTGLLSTHLESAPPKPDAVLLIGPKLFLDKKVPKEAIQAITESGTPVFYLNYVGNPRAYPWRDTLGSAVKTYGGKEFRITFPKDLAGALGEILDVLDSRSPVS
jgi:hypothetical protein